MIVFLFDFKSDYKIMQKRKDKTQDKDKIVLHDKLKIAFCLAIGGHFWLIELKNGLSLEKQ